ncbi:MAG: ABC transporter permease [Candidatus Eisenbacteria bacterium]
MPPAMKEWLRPVRAAARLGFQIESNWSDPLVFLVYALAKPLATSLILYVMFQVIVGAGAADPRFVALYVGNALYAYVLLLLVGLSWAVFEDREQYRMLKYVAIAPMGLVAYLLGRSWAKFVLATLSAAVVLGFGLVVLGMRFTTTPASLALFVVITLVGAAGVTAVGLVLAGCAMVFSRQSMTMNEGTAAVLYLLCGVVFPPDLLPRLLHPVSLALPVTWWMEASRRVLGARGFSAMLSAWPDDVLAIAFVAVTAAWLALALLLFASFERRARSLGLLDVTTAW